MSKSDSSCSDEEESMFKDVCDPTLWRTAVQNVEDDNASVKTATPHHLSSVRQSFLLLEKIMISLSNNKTKTSIPCVRSEDFKIHRRKSWMVDNSIENIAAPSTLSPYIAKQLALRLNRNVEYNSSQDSSLISQECKITNHESFHLLKNVSLFVQESEIKGNSDKKRKTKIPKRLTYYNSSDEDELKTRCSSITVSHEWIQAGGEYCPRPHPKNVRYLEEYKMKEQRSDGSIIAVPCSANVTKDFSKRKKCKPVVSESEENSLPCKKQNLDGLKSDVSGHKVLSINVKTPRKQARRRGKKKKIEKNGKSSHQKI